MIITKESEQLYIDYYKLGVLIVGVFNDSVDGNLKVDVDDWFDIMNDGAIGLIRAENGLSSDEVANAAAAAVVVGGNWNT